MSERYLSVQVFRSELGDCTNKGATSNTSARFVVPHPQGNIDSESISDGTYVILDPSEKGGQLNFVPRGVSGWTMAGGNFVYTCDSRFTSYSRQPVSVHDRVE